MSEFLLKPRICFGQDALSVLNELSARSVLLVTDKAMVKFGLAERVTALLRQPAGRHSGFKRRDEHALRH
ncbi:TPA: hypothetical protein MCQ42_003698 [Klebsiella pneumoniae]